MHNISSAENEKVVDNSRETELFNSVVNLEPKLITNFVPVDAGVQKAAFLSGEITNPNHDYARLDGVDFQANLRVLDDIQAELEGAVGNSKYLKAYLDFVKNYAAKTRFMELAYRYKHAANGSAKDQIADEYRVLNAELYGAPDEGTYRSLLAKKIDVVRSAELGSNAEKIRRELLEILANQQIEVNATREAFTPSHEVIEWMHGVVETLYGVMLNRVPAQDKFTPIEAAVVFQNIIDNEFGEAAVGWRVDVEPAKAINVKATEKRIVIPEDRADMSFDQMRNLVVHEIGVHMMRAITGGDTDLLPFKLGLSDYYDAEEGLGVVMEQALAREYNDRGVEHYLTTGLAYFDSQDFRGAFEVKWRLAVLEKAAAKGGVLTEKDVTTARDTAYGQTMRIFRGTDDLPWFKDLAYYNGVNKMWQHLEAIRGDDLQFMFVLMGKADPANKDHERLMYETHTP